jgi:GT2 family glycosyltransferase
MTMGRAKIVDLELEKPIETVRNLENYAELWALVRLHGAPLGWVKLPVQEGSCRASSLRQAIVSQLHQAILRHLFEDGLAGEPELHLGELAGLPHPAASGRSPRVTVAVCTRDRTENLASCLEALDKLDYPNLEILVVDNAPNSDATERLVRTGYPKMRYVREPRPGLDWARNRAILEAKGEVIAYTDDDVCVDPGWVRALVNIFEQDAQVMCVTGLVIPYELETEAQRLFEQYGGFDRGCQRRWFRACIYDGKEWNYRGTGQFGTGANMAYRKEVFEQIGPFDPALDVGTVTNGGGDLEMFYRILKEGWTLVYEPAAVVRHKHRPTYAQLRTQLANNGIGLYAYFVRSMLAYPEDRRPFLYLAVWWLYFWYLRRFIFATIWPTYFPKDLILVELFGLFRGLFRYGRARRKAREIDPSLLPSPLAERKSRLKPSPARPEAASTTGNYEIDLAQPWVAPAGAEKFSSLQISIRRSGRFLGRVVILNNYKPVSAAWMRDEIIRGLMDRLVAPADPAQPDLPWTALEKQVRRLVSVAADLEGEDQGLAQVPVSIVLATFDRPDNLKECLASLSALETARPVEVVVVDNHPASGLTPPVVAEFPGVKLVSEARKGLSYARNAGILDSSGEMIVCTDDDVIFPRDWLEKLLAPFASPQVMAVTGNVLPYQLETDAEHIFEAYGGLGRGPLYRNVGPDWFHSFRWRAVPTWELGGTANAAFRASIFSQPAIGLLEETLGAGMPAGVGEDTYCFYRILKAGYRIVYQPEAYLFHKHRRTLAALRKQIFDYSRGHVAYHLTTLFQDHDLRVLFDLGVRLPFSLVVRALRRIRSKSSYPLLFLAVEAVGYSFGPLAMLQSHLRVRKTGRSEAFIPARQRPAALEGRSTGDVLQLEG